MPGQTIAAASQQRAQTQQTVVQMVHSMGAELQRALPKGMDGDRVARLALTAIRKNPKLGECSKESFAGALLSASAMGLEPDVNGEAYLVPYGKECQLIVGYQGYAKLFWQHPNAQTLNAQTVYERDEFEYAYGLTPKLHHVPAKGDRGKPIFYYAAVSLSTGGQHFEVLTPEEVKELRGGKVGPDSRFKGGDPMRWMERKTAIRQALKPMPKSTQMALAVASDERNGTDLYFERVAETEPKGALTPGVNPATGEITDQAQASAAGEAGGEPTQEEIDAMAKEMR